MSFRPPAQGVYPARGLPESMRMSGPMDPRCRLLPMDPETEAESALDEWLWQGQSLLDIARDLADIYGPLLASRVLARRGLVACVSVPQTLCAEPA